MDRPASIVNFERAYLGALAIGIVNTAMSWSATREQVAQQEALIGTWVLPLATAIGFGISLLLWFFIARKGSAVAKWIATVLVALALVGLVFAFIMGTYRTGLSGILGYLSTALQAFAVWCLFRPDTRIWFGEKAGGDA